MAKKQNTMSAPAPAKRIVTTGLSKVALPEMPTMPSANPAAKMTGMGGTGVGFGPQAGVVGTGGGGGGGIPFFGLRMEAKRIAFLLDYSGSMSGAFRKSMEKELEHCLQGLPPGTQILIIPWAGPAWLVSQKAPEIADKWKMLDGYDNYVIKSGVTLPDPTWISTNSDTVREVMKQVRAQQALPGGTDWRSPFRYVMKANPTPDVIFFMTDGQIPATHTGRAMGAINDALTKAQKVPKVNCLWIENKTPECLPDQLKKLAAKYHGDFVEVH